MRDGGSERERDRVASERVLGKKLYLVQAIFLGSLVCEPSLSNVSGQK